MIILPDRVAPTSSPRIVLPTVRGDERTSSPLGESRIFVSSLVRLSRSSALPDH